MTAPERIAKGLYWDEAWSLVGGCTHVSPGCDNCWSAKETDMRAGHPNEIIRNRNQGLTWPDGSFNGIVQMNPEFLDKPLKKRKPTTYAVWNDLFHESVPFEFIDYVFAVMGRCQHHTFILLTKRPRRMLEYTQAGRYQKILNIAYGLKFRPKGLGKGIDNPNNMKWWPNVWLGVTAENQQTADERIPILLQIPAPVRWVSVEPMLGPVNLTSIDHGWQINALTGKQSDMGRPYYDTGKLHWVACGGESGHGARPLHPDWERSLRDQCISAGVPYFFKQHGEWLHESQIAGCKTELDPDYIHNYLLRYTWTKKVNDVSFRVGKKKAGRLLDGRTYDEIPNKGGSKIA